ncbi:exopolygalacturonase [Cocos nucifera]|uniref:Exopolygalacturonase n=1 Tax=Cocos nucifera TaxID=13894 RepID=A0A8K0MUA5_COCNU|nr:exopolygalacturonase [Cocos nucifera]
MLVNLNNTIVNDIKSVNSKFFHIGVLGCQNFQGSGIKITAPAESPNTDGIHLERNSGVTITNSEIATGDDCVSVGQGNSHVTLNGIRCGPGHGIRRYLSCLQSLMLVNLNNTIVNDIKSVNSKFFHIGVLGCQNFQGSGIKITAPAESPNTDGIHLERNSGVTITNSEIATGDDCVSVGQGNSHVTLNGIRCGPGHGISLGRYKNEMDVQGLIVQDCSLTDTDNGLRIKTWANSPTSSVCANMTFENIVMNNVANPIIIDQTYCPYANCGTSASSKVKISDIHFRNITGTSKTPVAVNLECSQGIPCEKVSLQDVDLKFTGQNSTFATCLNVKAQYSGTQNPPPCQ